MSISRSFTLVAAAVLAAVAAPTFAQDGHGKSHAHTAPQAASAQPYSGQQLREIKALSAQDQQDWLEGKGMGLAKAAELNGYPGPMHVLEFASELSLSAEQRHATSQLMAGHKAEVKAMGARLVAAEQALDRAFSQGVPSHEDVSRLTLEIGTLQARIRAAHLQTHLTQTALLQPEQVARYQRLRGY